MYMQSECEKQEKQRPVEGPGEGERRWSVRLPPKGERRFILPGIQLLPAAAAFRTKQINDEQPVPGEENIENVDNQEAEAGELPEPRRQRLR